MGAFSYSWSRFNYDIKIGRYCSIAHDVTIIPPSHPLDFFTTSSVTYDRKLQSLKTLLDSSSEDKESPNQESIPPWENTYQKKNIEPITIENDVYIGRSAVLRPGIKIGIGSVVAAHSVVTKDVPPYSLVAGNPARIKKKRFPDEIAQELLRLKWWDYQIEGILKMGEPQNIETFIGSLKTKINNGDIQRQEINYITYEQIISHSN